MRLEGAMAQTTSIEWTDATWTPVRARTIELQSDGSGRERIGWHCEHISEGCRNCYAERINSRLGTGRPYKPAELKHRTRHGDSRGSVSVFLDEKMLAQPQHWRRPRDIFVCSMTDLFADFVSDDVIDKVFAAMGETPWHHFQVLTKRAKRMRAYITTPGRRERILTAAMGLSARDVIRLCDDPEPWPLPHVTMMVSAETQSEANERIPDLLATPAAMRGLSLEPMLGPIRLRDFISRDLVRCCPRCRWEGRGPRGSGCPSCGLPSDDGPLHWVICGGESGPGARPMHPDWARSLRDQCAAAGVPFLFKQWGVWAPYDRGRVDSRKLATPGALDAPMQRFGKKLAGRLLDGVEHNGSPGHQ